MIICFIYLRTFGGIATDEIYETETRLLKNYLKEKNIEIYGYRCICISYDPPFKLIGRKNEVLLIKK